MHSLTMQREDLIRLRIPEEAGVYSFLKGRKIQYVGKAAVLKDRVRSYFAKDIAETRSPAIALMVKEATALTWQTTESVLEALILEANLIKQYQPPYNVANRDNKSFNYLVITKEDFPRVLVVRGRELFQSWDEANIKHLFGPFPHGLQLQEAMKIVRKIFPCRDSKCVPCPDQISGFRKSRYRDLRNPDMSSYSCKPCFNRQIGLCPGVCTGETSKEEYAVMVKHIVELFRGNFKGLKRQLSREMKEAAHTEDFEKAVRLRRQCEALEHIRDVSLIKSERVSAGGGARVEAYDVAHTSGQETVGVMAVVHNGEAVKGAYRMFKIRSATNDDVAALVEMLERRLNHTEWQLPRVFAIDGGKAQVRAVEKVLKKAGIQIPVVGVVKNERHRPERFIGNERVIAANERDILLANAEAHRFGINYHRKRRQRSTLQ